MIPLTTTVLTPDEFSPYYQTYIRTVPPVQPVDLALQISHHCVDAWLGMVLPQQQHFAYGPDKWTVAQVIQHLIDSERVFAYRALRVSRGDQTPLPGYDQDDYAAAAGTDLNFEALRKEFGLVRATTRALFSSFSASELERRGTASDAPISVRAQGYIIAGHTYHHARLFEERYAAAVGK